MLRVDHQYMSTSIYKSPSKLKHTDISIWFRRLDWLMEPPTNAKEQRMHSTTN